MPRVGTPKSDPKAEALRLKRNEQSRRYKENMRKLEAAKDKVMNEINNCNVDEDEYGIRPVDERRYRACFKNRYVGEIVERTYVKTMTGLSLKQISILEKRTGLIPYPSTTASEIQKEWENGDYY